MKEQAGAQRASIARLRHKLDRTPSRFILVGLTATGVYFVTANALVFLTPLPPPICAVLAYFAGMAVSYYGQSRVTFAVREPGIRHIVRFGMLSGLGIVMSYGAVALAIAVQVGPTIGILVSTILVPIVNFFAMKLWVFK